MDDLMAQAKEFKMPALAITDHGNMFGAIEFYKKCMAGGIKPLPKEKVVPKRRYSAFYATDLELSLRTMKVSQVVVAGLFTNVCVEATVRDAFMRDFFVFLPADACSSLNEELHLGSLRTIALWFAKVLTVEDLIGRTS